VRRQPRAAARLPAHCRAPPWLKSPQSTEDSEDIEIPEINRLLQDLTHAASLGLLSSLGLPLWARGRSLE